MPPRIGPKNLRLARVYLREWREFLYPTLSLEQFGQRFSPEVDKGTVSRWENSEPGKLTLGVIAAYAEALNRSPSEMYARPIKGEQTLDQTAASLGIDRSDVLAYMDALSKRRA